jgi:hypothetical protein
MDMKRKTCGIPTWKKHLFLDIYSTNIDSPIPIPLRRIPQLTSFLTIVSATSTPPFQPFRQQQNICHQDGTIYAINSSHHKEKTFIHEYPLH